MGTLSNTISLLTGATVILVFLRIVFARGRSTGYRSTRLVTALIVLVAVTVLMIITLVSMVQVSGSLTK